jgi:hypothetical protein
MYIQRHNYANYAIYTNNSMMENNFKDFKVINLYSMESTPNQTITDLEA